jgi:hypothetical protein
MMRTSHLQMVGYRSVEILIVTVSFTNIKWDYQYVHSHQPSFLTHPHKLLQSYCWIGIYDCILRFKMRRYHRNSSYQLFPRELISQVTQYWRWHSNYRTWFLKVYRYLIASAFTIGWDVGDFRSFWICSPKNWMISTKAFVEETPPYSFRSANDFGPSFSNWMVSTWWVPLLLAILVSKKIAVSLLFQLALGFCW